MKKMVETLHTTAQRLKNAPLVLNTNGFFPCKTCSNILTPDCYDDCIFVGDFKHYKQRPGTDIKEMPAFPLEQILDEENARDRLVTVAVYLAAITDYLQHMDEYEKNREYRNKYNTYPEDYSI